MTAPSLRGSIYGRRPRLRREILYRLMVGSAAVPAAGLNGIDGGSDGDGIFPMSYWTCITLGY